MMAVEVAIAPGFFFVVFAASNCLTVLILLCTIWNNPGSGCGCSLVHLLQIPELMVGWGAACSLLILVSFMVTKVNHGRLREDEARKYFQQLINAVDYCHSRGVSHRDLKPENLLLDAHGNLKVSDFGLSALPQQIREDGLLHTTCGTPNYVAPEVINDKGYDGATADLWSCGVILFVLMTGYLPFDKTNLLTLYKKIHKADFTCPSWFSSSAKKLISRILDPKPKTRITVPEILENDWFKKGYKPPKFPEDKEISLDDVDAVFNDLEGLVKRETRFTSKRSAKEIISKIESAAGPLVFTVKRQNYKMKLQGAETGRKGHLSVATEVFEVAPSLFMVEVCKSGGDTLEFHKFYKNLSSGLKDIVWKSKAVMEEDK